MYALLYMDIIAACVRVHECVRLRVFLHLAL